MPPLIKNRAQDAEEEVRSIIDEKQDINDNTESSTKEYRLQIVWRNVVIMAYLHIAAVYGLYLVFTAAMFKTFIAGKMTCP